MAPFIKPSTCRRIRTFTLSPRYILQFGIVLLIFGHILMTGYVKTSTIMNFQGIVSRKDTNMKSLSAEQKPIKTTVHGYATTKQSNAIWNIPNLQQNASLFVTKKAVLDKKSNKSLKTPEILQNIESYQTEDIAAIPLSEIGGEKSTFCNSTMTYTEYFGESTKILNPYKYKTLLAPNTRYCSKSTFAVILIMSLHDHVDQRKAIRDTWGNWMKNSNNTLPKDVLKQLSQTQRAELRKSMKNIVPLFVFGKHKLISMDKLIQNELEEFNDVIQADFAESYKSLVTKNAFAYRFIAKNCSNAKFVIKVDDDNFANLPYIVKALLIEGHQHSIRGRCIARNEPKRTRSKNAISCQIYPLNKYPPYTNGNPGYVVPVSALEDMIWGSQYLPPLPIEDVFFTGIVAAKMNISKHCDNRFTPGKGNSFFERSNGASTYTLWNNLATNVTLV